jgi:hypothetical protein
VCHQQILYKYYSFNIYYRKEHRIRHGFEAKNLEWWKACDLIIKGVPSQSIAKPASMRAKLLDRGAYLPRTRE